ncbi:MAG: magnesium transporter [Candidatus Calescibacterium sp.]|nr:magnesium transporter [Candidatus Calescibacterium sp.]MDW8132443.1 magnesium transporter [Candidatus Calescibacterium sp.]
MNHEELKESIINSFNSGNYDFISDPHFFDEINIPIIAKAINSIEDWEIIKSFLTKLPIEKISLILTELDDSIVEKILKEIGIQNIVEIITSLDEEEAAELIDQLPDEIKKQIILKLDPKEYTEIEEYLKYPENTAARLTTKSFLKIYPYYTVGETLEIIRKKSELEDLPEFLNYIYIVDSEEKLVGVISLKELVISKPYIQVKSIMSKNLIKIDANKDKEEAAKILRDYNILSLPVVDQNNKLLGIITHDDIIEVIFEEYTEDILKSGAVQSFEESYIQITPFQLALKRATWLVVLFLASSITSNVISGFSDTIEKYVQLSFFIPLLIGTGGNSGSQSAVTILRSLALNELSEKDFIYILKKELKTAILLGLQIGIIAILYTLTMGILVLKIEWKIIPVVVISQILIVIWSTIVGSTLPIIAKKLKIDPAVMSAPFITTFVDATGLIIYFTIAKIILQI